MRRALILLFLSSGLSFSRAEQPSSYVFDEDVRALCAVRLVAFDLISMVGRSEGEVLLGRILKREDKIRPLLEVYNRGTTEAKVYALAAFHYLAPQLFAQCKKDIVGKYNPTVRAQAGCLPHEGNLLEFIIRIHHGEYDYYIRKYADG